VSRSRTYLTLAILLLATLGMLASWARQAAADLDRNRLPAMRQLVRTLQLTDLALWSEARYTRHPAMADLFSAFQDVRKPAVRVCADLQPNALIAFTQRV